MASPPPRLFVCYAREDAGARDELVEGLGQLGKDLVDVWTDQGGIPGAALWLESIKKAIGSSSIGVILASRASMSSSFIRETELPLLLGALEAGRLRLHVVHLEPSHAARPDYTFVPLHPDGTQGEPRSLASIQYAHQPHETLIGLDPAALSDAWHKVVEAIERDARALGATFALRQLLEDEEEGALAIRSAVRSLGLAIPDGVEDTPDALPAAAVAAALDNVSSLSEVTERLAALLQATKGPVDPGLERRREWLRKRKRLLLAGAAALVALLVVPLAALGAVRATGWSLVGPTVVEARCEGDRGVLLRVRNPSAVDATLSLDREDIRLTCADGRAPGRIYRGPRGGTCQEGVGDPTPPLIPAWSLRAQPARFCMIPADTGCSDGAVLSLLWEGDGLRSDPQEIPCIE